MRRLILKSFQSPGDILMLTAAVRDLHAAHPGEFQTDVRTSAADLWLHNPYITPLKEREDSHRPHPGPLPEGQSPHPGPLPMGEGEVEIIDMHYPLIHQSNQRPYHFIHGYAQYLEERLGVRIPLTRFHGDIHLSAEEKALPVPGAEFGVPERFWIIVAGGKYDFTAKWWNPASYQAVVNALRGGKKEARSVSEGGPHPTSPRGRGEAKDEEDKTNIEHSTSNVQCRTTSQHAGDQRAAAFPHAEREGYIQFVQCGEAGHWHLPLEGAINLVGKTTLREFVRLMYHADGVVCPVTFAMHLAAAVEVKQRPRTECAGHNVAAFPHAEREGYNSAAFPHAEREGYYRASRPCVVIAGGREPTHWEAYPTHQYISTVGMLPCCETGGCWKSRCQSVGDGDEKDRRDLCERPVQISPELRIPECLEMIRPADVLRRVEMYMRRRNGKVTSGLVAGRLVTQSSPLAPREVSALAPREQPATTHQSPAHQTPSHPVLLEFRHGLGDAVQLTVVLRHLAKLRPDWQVDVAALAGKHSALAGLCRQTLVIDKDPIDRSHYKHVYKLEWHESQGNSAEWPNTKATRCLQEVFGITPERELCGYEIRIGEESRERARKYLGEMCAKENSPRSRFGLVETGAPADDSVKPHAEREDYFASATRFPAVLIHYEGNTSAERKNLPHELAREVCETVLRLGYVPVILDWDRRSPLPDGPTLAASATKGVRIHNPGADHELWQGRGTGDAETLAALIESAALMIGIDSGPLHVAGATGTPTLGVWTHHHPVHFFDLAPNVLHLVPGDHEKLAAGSAALEGFRRHYRAHVYKQLFTELPAMVESVLTGQNFDELANNRFLGQLTATAYGARYYEEHKLAGLDYLSFGAWHEEYGRWFVESLGLKGRKVLDVGCACGAILRGLGQAGAVVQGVELNEHMVQLGRAKWPDMAPLLFVCDAVNLHLFGDESWDAIHSAQVAEHWKPELVPFILRELARVVRPGGLFFAAFDTEELFARQGRSIETEDPTHVCIRPLAWWHEQLTAAGWKLCTAEFEPALRNHRESFLRRYDWDWFVARKAG